MKAANNGPSPVVYFPVVNNGVKGLDQCCVCGKVGQFGDFSMIAIGKKSGASYCEDHESDMNAEVRRAERKQRRDAKR